MHANAERTRKAHRRTVIACSMAAATLCLTAACSSSGGKSSSSKPRTTVDAAIVAAAKSAGYDFSSTPKLAKMKIKIGQELALTGGAAFFGDVMSKGSQLAADQIRKAGGPDITFVKTDNKAGTPAAGVAAARQLISSDKVTLIQSSFGPSTLAIVPLITQSKILTFNPAGATADQLGKGDYLWMARATVTDSYPPLADYGKSITPGATKAAMVVANDPSSIGAADLVTNRWKDNGGTIVANEKVATGSTDMKAQIAKVKAASPDVVFFVLFGADYQVALKEARQSGIKTPIIGSDWSAQGHTATGALDEGYVYTSDAYDPALPGPFNQMFVSGYKAAYNVNPEAFAGGFYENTWHIAELAQRTLQDGGDPTKSVDLLAALKKAPNMPSSLVCAPISWDLTTHAQLGKPQGLYKIKGGKSERIALIYGADLRLGAELPCKK